MSNIKATPKGKKVKAEKETKVIKETKKTVKTEEIKKEVKTPPKIENPEIKKPNYVEPSYGTEQIDYDDVYDEADIASALEMGFIAKALADHKNKVAPESHPDFDGEHCIDCDADIPEIRLNMGKIRCVDCQSELELRNKLKGRK